MKSPIASMVTALTALLTTGQASAQVPPMTDLTINILRSGVFPYYAYERAVDPTGNGVIAVRKNDNHQDPPIEQYEALQSWSGLPSKYVWRSITGAGQWGTCLWQLNGTATGYGSTGWQTPGGAAPQVYNSCGTSLTGTVIINVAYAVDPVRTIIKTVSHTFVFQ